MDITYANIWKACSDIDEVLECTQESGNRTDMHAIAVKKEQLTIGQVPKFTSLIYSIFIQRGRV